MFFIWLFFIFYLTTTKRVASFPAEISSRRSRISIKQHHEDNSLNYKHPVYRASPPSTETHANANANVGAINTMLLCLIKENMFSLINQRINWQNTPIGRSLQLQLLYKSSCNVYVEYVHGTLAAGNQQIQMDVMSLRQSKSWTHVLQLR